MKKHILQLGIMGKNKLIDDFRMDYRDFSQFVPGMQVWSQSACYSLARRDTVTYKVIIAILGLSVLPETEIV